MTHYSLRLRLLAGAAVAIFAALAIAWLAMILLFERHLDRRIEEELQRTALQLVSGLEVDGAGAPVISRRPIDPRFDAPASGLYWQISTGRQIERSRSLWDQTLPDPPEVKTQAWQSRIAHGPFEQRILLVERVIRPDGDAGPVLVQLAHDEETVRIASGEYGRELAMSLAILWLVLSGAVWAQVQLGLKPLTKLRSELATLKRSPAERLGPAHPREVAPLIEAINDLADTREADLRRARQRAADLAHGMKTPLAALAAQNRLIRRNGGDAAAADAMDRAIAAAAAAVEAELARARAAASRHERQDVQAAPLVVAEGVAKVLERTDKGMQLDIEIDVPPEMRLHVSVEDLSAILGPLLENAVRYARRTARVTGATEESASWLRVEDDGPGLDAEQARTALARGTRLDEAGGGHGLGLAIARELVEATGGTIRLGVSEFGGLAVTLCW